MKPVYVREMRIHLHLTAIIYIFGHVSISTLWITESREIKLKTARDV